ncbi:MAG: hypothetical protein P1R74_00840 [Sedimenticola sp.]|nr:hypothetical protein [Sedimenticola sp.]
MTKAVIGKCWHCGTELLAADFGRETSCLSCGKPSRVCKNCRWYDIARTNQCQEPMAERIQEKERANYCEFFEPTMDLQSEGTTASQSLRQSAEDLFK